MGDGAQDPQGFQALVAPELLGVSSAELSLRALRTVDRDLADVGEVEAPEFVALS
jgi:hypothetical protein